MKVGQTEPLPMCAEDWTRIHLPSASNDLSAGISSCAIVCRLSAGSVASRPIAKTRPPLCRLIQKYLWVDPLLQSPFVRSPVFHPQAGQTITNLDKRAQEKSQSAGTQASQRCRR